MIIRELGSGKYSDCFKIQDRKTGCSVACKVSYYQEATIRAFARHTHHGNRNAAFVAKDQDAISVSMAMAEVAKQLKRLRVSPHFVKVFCEADVRHLPTRLLPLLSKRLPRLSPNQLKYSHACIMEVYSCDLTTLLTQTRVRDSTLRVLLFQVLYTLACLQTALTGFRHNDLSSNNVLVKPWWRGQVCYSTPDMTYVTAAPLMAAVSDFDFTHVPGHAVLSNERVLSGKYGISAHPDDAYDAHTLMRSVLNCLLKSGRCPRARAFIQELISTQADMRPARLLLHPYFGPLRDTRAHRQCVISYAFA